MTSNKRARTTDVEPSIWRNVWLSTVNRFANDFSAPDHGAAMSPFSDELNVVDLTGGLFDGPSDSRDQPINSISCKHT
jgi:hypothetical protein